MTARKKPIATRYRGESGGPGYPRAMYELRAARAGRVTAILVDEGQMVGEEDEIATLATADGPASVVTDVPGVVREIFAVAGGTVDTGSVIALIDES